MNLSTTRHISDPVQRNQILINHIEFPTIGVLVEKEIYETSLKELREW